MRLMPSEVLVALIAAVPATIIALATWRQTKQANKKLGDSEGDQTVMEILLDVVGWQANHDLRHQWLESGEAPKWNFAPALSVKHKNSSQRTGSTSTAGDPASLTPEQAETRN